MAVVFISRVLLSSLVIRVTQDCSPSLLSELVEYFRTQMRTDPDMASAVAAIRTLLEFLRRDKGLTTLLSA